MEISRIFNKKEDLVGELGVFDNRNLSYNSLGDEMLNSIIKKALQNGVLKNSSIYDLSSDTIRHEILNLTKEDEGFLEALSFNLGISGYRMVREKQIEDEEIEKILRNFENNNSDKKEILNRLWCMSKLEKTMLLIELRKISEENV